MDYQVVVRKRNKETRSEPMNYMDAYRLYEEQAPEINATDEEGNYLNPSTRISISPKE
jgi:hypothetical protein